MVTTGGSTASIDLSFVYKAENIWTLILLITMTPCSKNTNNSQNPICALHIKYEFAEFVPIYNAIRLHYIYGGRILVITLIFAK